MRFLTRFLMLFVLTTPVFALSLGDMSVKSQFGQPLEAEIEIPSFTAIELQELSVKLAERSVFEKSGVEWSSTLGDLQFKLRQSKSQNPIIRVTSTKPLRELALSFFVEATWSGGRLVRGYDVLLTPTERKSPATDANILNRQSPATDSTQIVPVVVDTVPTGRSESSQLSYGPVKPGEILGVIARRMIPNRDYTLQQVMLGIYEQNSHAFSGGNINRLEPGFMLKLESESSVGNTGHQQALDLIEQHTSQWRGEAANLQGNGEAVFRIEEVDAPPQQLEILSPGSNQIMGDGRIKPTEVDSLRRELTVTLEAAEELKQKNEELKARVDSLEKLIAQRMAQLMPEKAALINLGENTSIINKSNEVYRDDLVRNTTDISVRETQESYFAEIMGAILVLVGGIIIYILYSQRQGGFSIEGMGKTSFLKSLKRRFKRKSNTVTLRV